MPKLTIVHDGEFNIATGRHRKETSWKNKPTLWSAFLEKISKTHRTSETYLEYIAAKKPRQDEIKDVGGFVGGYLAHGRRKADNVLHRQLLTLDLDYVHGDPWDTFTILYDNAAAMYSTHKHNPEAPRLRLLMPLSREVTGAEYEAIGRQVAGLIGIELFDPTTFQPERLMYWPSSSKDAEYIYHLQDGEWLDADEVLASYTDWQDSSEWPVSAKVDKIIQRNIKKQGDPLEKPGIVGAFCRTHTIAEAIDRYLGDIYDPTDIDNRYTYKNGSTSAGLIVYDNKYTYSHHGTDPTSGKLCNAFDLVRLHLYGLKDEDARPDTPINKLPSFTAMAEKATKDKDVRLQIGEEKLESAQTAFAEFLNASTPEDIGSEVDAQIYEDTVKNLDKKGASSVEEVVSNEWLADLECDKKGNYTSTIDNIYKVLMNDPALAGRIRQDDFLKRTIILKPLPWRRVTKYDNSFSDRDDACLRHYLEKTYEMQGVQKVADAFDRMLQTNSFHPVKEYLNSVTWDGLKRIDSLLIDFLGAEDSAYVRAVTRKTLIAGVARIFKPGIKFDNVLTLVGEQGVGKSTLIAKLGKRWYSDTFLTVQGKDAYEQIQGVWIMEIGELAALNKADLEAIKLFVSKQEDNFRAAYARRKDNCPRQCIFIATTNIDDFLRDVTGNRRWWPVRLGIDDSVFNVFNDLTPDVVDQLWAEAVTAFRSGEKLHLDSELEETAKGHQKEHMEVDDRMDVIVKYLDTKVPANWKELDIYQRRAFLKGDEFAGEGVKTRKIVTAAEIWCEALDGWQKDMTRHNTKFIHDIMRQLPN